MEKLTVEAFRAGLGGYLDRVHFLRETFLVTKNGLPYVRVEPVSPKIKPSKTINALQIRQQVGQVLGRAHFINEPCLVLRRGRPVAIINGIKESDG